MANKNTVRRDYIIIKRLQKGDFPTKQELLDCLAARDCIVDPRTLDRDIEHIRSNFDIEVVYDPQQRGYTIDEQSSMDLDKVMHFWELAESSDIIVSSFGEWRQAMRYISISPAQSPQGVQHIKPLLEAFRTFGLDRIENLSVTSEFKRDPRTDYLYRRHWWRLQHGN